MRCSLVRSGNVRTLRARVSVGEEIIIAGICCLLLNNAPNYSYSRGSAHNVVSQVGELVYCCRSLVNLMVMVVTVEDLCCRRRWTLA